MSPFALFRAAISALGHFRLLVVTYLPGGLGNDLRRWYFRKRLKSCGRNVTIDQGVIIQGAELISLGDNVHIDKNCIIATGPHLMGRVTHVANDAFKHARGELVIGNDVHIVQQCIIMAFGGVTIGDRCTLSAGTKVYSLTNTPYLPEDRGQVVSIMPYNQAPFLCSPVVLDENVWVGLNGILMPGVTIGKNSFVVSNSLVMGRFPANSYLQGQPAVRTRPRFQEPANG